MKILTVTELNIAIKRHLEPHFSHVKVQGEVINLRFQSSGHIYFSLKDQGAQISAVLFKGNTRNIAHIPKSGDQVILYGELNLYALRGSYQIIIREIKHAGVGELLIKLHRLKEELQQKGWFNSEHKKPLPKYPKTIGVVTSPTGAVIQDIIHILKRRYPYFHLLLNPVKVQGDGAEREIAQAIHTLNIQNLCDVIIVGRGGGSLEDLWPFNEKVVAQAIFQSKIPVISAVGHETDVTLADCVADVRAPTPSAAAEISVQELSVQNDFLYQMKKKCHHILKQMILHKKALLKGIVQNPLFVSPYNMLTEHYQRIDDFQNQLDLSIQYRLSRQKLRLISFKRELEGKSPQGEMGAFRQKLDDYIKRLSFAIKNIFQRKKEHLKALAEHIESVNPENILKKGYCIPFAEKDNSIMMNSQQAAVGERIQLRFHDGTIRVRIEKANGKKIR